MKVTVENLGPFESLELEIRDSGLVHIYGDSGIGKSSLFTVIMWILTGQPRNGIVNIKSGKSGKVFGILEYGTLTVTRSKRPEKLEVSYGKIFLEGDPAAAYLESLYGPSKLLFASCYLQQKSLHPLLEISAKDRLQLLQSLIDTTDKPEKYIAIVNKRISDITTRKQALDEDIKITKKQMGKFKQEELEELDQDPEELEEERNNLNEKLEKLQKSLATFHSLSGSLKVIETSLNSLTENKLEIPSIEAEIITIKEEKNNKEKEYLLAIQYKAELGTRKRIESLKKEFESYPVPNFNHKDYNLEKLTEIETTRETGIKLCKKLDIEYELGAISFLIQQLTKDSEYYSTLPMRKKIEVLAAKITSPPVYSLDDLKKWQLESTLLKCPNCEAGLKYNNGVLHLEKSPGTEIPISVDKISTEIIKVKEYMKNKESHDSLLSTIPNQLEPTWPKEKCDLLPELKKIKVIEKSPVTSVDLKSAIARNKVESVLSEYKVSDISIQRAPDIVKKEISALENKLESLTVCLSNQKRYKELLKSKLELEEKLKEYEGIEKKYKKYKKKSETLTSRIHYLLEAANAKEKLEQLKKYQKEYEELASELKQLGEIKKIMVNIEYQMLSEKIAGLNTIINENLEALFSEPFTVVINSVKPIKSTSQEKDEINLKYYLNGLEFDSVNILSGGQADRLSLAIMIAFSSMSLIPIVMFDETLASLNDTLRDSVRDVIKECLSDKLVLIISHNDGTGEYDEQINMKDFI